MKKIIAFVAVAFMVASSVSADETFDISGVTSFGFQGDPGNTTLTWDLGTGGPVEITSLDWDVTITTFDISWLDEASFELSTSGGTSGVISPGTGDAFAGTGSYAGSLGTSLLDDDGIVEIEFFEVGFDDVAGGDDAIYDAGSSITVGFDGGPAIPEPTSVAVLAVTALGLVRRRR